MRSWSVLAFSLPGQAATHRVGEGHGALCKDGPSERKICSGCMSSLGEPSREMVRKRDAAIEKLAKKGGVEASLGGGYKSTIEGEEQYIYIYI